MSLVFDTDDTDDADWRGTRFIAPVAGWYAVTSGRLPGCPCGLTGSIEAPKVAEIDSRCPHHGFDILEGHQGSANPW